MLCIVLPSRSWRPLVSSWFFVAAPGSAGVPAWFARDGARGLLDRLRVLNRRARPSGAHGDDALVEGFLRGSRYSPEEAQ